MDARVRVCACMCGKHLNTILFTKSNEMHKPQGEWLTGIVMCYHKFLYRNVDQNVLLSMSLRYDYNFKAHSP